MFVLLVFLPYPGMMKKAVGMGMKPMKRIGNGSGTTSTKSRWVCAKWVGIPLYEIHRLFAVSLSYRHKSFLALTKINYCILLLLVLLGFFTFCTSTFAVSSIFWVSNIIWSNAAYSFTDFSAVDPVVFNTSDISKNRLPHSASLAYSSSKGELLALILIVCLVSPIVVHFQYLYNFSINFPWSGAIKCVFCASRPACVLQEWKYLTDLCFLSGQRTRKGRFCSSK